MTGLQHWAEAYVGRPYIEGRHDCAHFVIAVLRERFGREIALPAHRPVDGARAGLQARATGVREWDARIAAHRGAFAAPAETPREGDGVLMVAAARRRCIGHHIGIWCAVGAEPYVLHCVRGAGSIFHPLRDLGRRALALEGIYRWL